jgi:hypothetical protein
MHDDLTSTALVVAEVELHRVVNSPYARTPLQLIFARLEVSGSGGKCPVLLRHPLEYELVGVARRSILLPYTVEVGGAGREDVTLVELEVEIDGERAVFVGCGEFELLKSESFILLRRGHICSTPSLTSTIESSSFVKPSACLQST